MRETNWVRRERPGDRANKPSSVETLEEIAERIPRDWIDVARNGTAVSCVLLEQDKALLVNAILSALRNEREAERDRITAAIAGMYWHFDCGSERDTVLAIPHLPSCTCLAKDNQEATEYQHHHNTCPVYIRVMAIREGK